jgi:hypothetical protein
MSIWFIGPVHTCNFEIKGDGFMARNESCDHVKKEVPRNKEKTKVNAISRPRDARNHKKKKKKERKQSVKQTKRVEHILYVRVNARAPNEHKKPEQSTGHMEPRHIDTKFDGICMHRSC